MFIILQDLDGLFERTSQVLFMLKGKVACADRAQQFKENRKRSEKEETEVEILNTTVSCTDMVY